MENKAAPPPIQMALQQLVEQVLPGVNWPTLLVIATVASAIAIGIYRFSHTIPEFAYRHKIWTQLFEEPILATKVSVTEQLLLRIKLSIESAHGKRVVPYGQAYSVVLTRSFSFVDLLEERSAKRSDLASTGRHWIRLLDHADRLRDRMNRMCATRWCVLAGVVALCLCVMQPFIFPKGDVSFAVPTLLYGGVFVAIAGFYGYLFLLNHRIHHLMKVLASMKEVDVTDVRVCADQPPK
jgi:hypothetical protein